MSAMKLEDGTAAVPPDQGVVSSDAAPPSTDRQARPAILRLLPDNKGDASNMLAFLVMVMAIGLHANSPDAAFLKYLLSFGLFSFAGGITNWLAVKMLFDRIPGVKTNKTSVRESD